MTDREKPRVFWIKWEWSTMVAIYKTVRKIIARINVNRWIKGG